MSSSRSVTSGRSPSRRRAAASAVWDWSTAGDRLGSAVRASARAPVEQPDLEARAERASRQGREQQVALAALVPPRVDAPRVGGAAGAAGRARRREVAPGSPQEALAVRRRSGARRSGGEQRLVAGEVRERSDLAGGVRAIAALLGRAAVVGERRARAAASTARRRGGPSARTRRGTPSRPAPVRRGRGAAARPTASWSGWPSWRQVATSTVSRPSPTSSTRAVVSVVLVVGHARRRASPSRGDRSAPSSERATAAPRPPRTRRAARSAGVWVGRVGVAALAVAWRRRATTGMPRAGAPGDQAAGPERLVVGVGRDDDQPVVPRRGRAADGRAAGRRDQTCDGVPGPWAMNRGARGVTTAPARGVGEHLLALARRGRARRDAGGGRG